MTEPPKPTPGKVANWKAWIQRKRLTLKNVYPCTEWTENELEFVDAFESLLAKAEAADRMAEELKTLEDWPCDCRFSEKLSKNCVCIKGVRGFVLKALAAYRSLRPVEWEGSGEKAGGV